jgi:hypothetical protein
MVENDDHRAALRAWVVSKATRKTFAKWYRSRGVSRVTAGGWRKLALKHIVANLVRNPSQNAQSCQIEALPNHPEITDIHATIEIDVPKSKASWQVEPFLMIPRPELADFSWAAKRNELRRQRAKRKRKVDRSTKAA